VNSTILPFHAVSGRQAIGWRNARRGETGQQPIWPIAGAAEDDENADDPTEDEAKSDEDDKPDEDPEGAEQLGDAGKKALDAMKRQMREERTKRRAAEAQLAELSAKAQPKPEENGKPDGDAPDLEALRREVEAEVAARIKAELGVEQGKERVLNKIEVLAAKPFADPADAPLMLLREHKIEDFLDDNGNADVEAIQDGLKDLLEKKPYLAAQGGKRFQGSGDGGARPPKPARPKSINEAVSKRLSP
jgi:hypothetical protein